MNVMPFSFEEQGGNGAVNASGKCDQNFGHRRRELKGYSLTLKGF